MLEQLLNPYNLQIVLLVLINTIMGLSVFTPLSAGQLSLGSAGFMSIGAYTAALLALKAGWPMFLTIPAGAVVAAVCAFILGYPTLRLQGVYLAIATLGFGEMVRILMLNLSITNGALGLPGIPNLANKVLDALYAWNWPEPLAGLYLDQWATLIVLVLLGLVVGIILFFLISQTHSRVGRALGAIKLDEMAASCMGIDIRKYKLLVFAESGFLAGLGGALYAHLYFFIGPGDFGFSRAIEILVMPVLGGSGTVWGTLFGAGLLTTLPEFLRFSEGYRPMVYGLLLLLTVIFRPQGVLVPRTLRHPSVALAKTPPKGEDAP